MRTLLVAIGLALLLAGVTFRAIASAGAGPPAPVAKVATSTRERVLLVFVDSLEQKTARDAALMPALARLAERGAAFDVEPCRDQVTYRCLEAAFTGRDGSSLVDFHRNFDESARSEVRTLFDEAKEARRTVVAIGARDLSPYGAAFRSARYLSRSDERAEVFVREWQDMERTLHPDVVIVGLGSGDLAAHAHGMASREYRAAFRNVDAIIDALVRSVPSDVHVVVFGDHGHDEKGRHLPGGPGKTYAVYAGPAFAAGTGGQLALTDHRALLGTLLGLPTPRSYAGPPPSGIFAAPWTANAFGGALPDLRPPPGEPPTEPGSALLFFCACAFGVLALGAAFAFHFPGARWTWGASTVLVGLVALAGAQYDGLRQLIHDQGDSPARSLLLLVPAAVGFTAAAVLRRTGALRAARPGAWLPTGAAASLVATLLLLFPCAYYYGSSRAVVFASILVVASLIADTRHELPGGGPARLAVRAAAGFALAALATFCRVDHVVTSVESAYVLKAPVYAGKAALVLVLGKLVVFALLYPRARSRPLDLAGAASLLTASALVQLADARMPPLGYAAVALALLGTSGLSSRAPMTHFAGGLLLLNHFYRGAPTELAPMEVLLSGVGAALFAWNNTQMAPDSRDAASGLTLVTGAYLLLWPTLGFRLSGIDFQFMFEWVEPERYERLWWVIACGTLVKFAVPYLLLWQLAANAGAPRSARAFVATALSAKVALLSVLAAAYAAGHSTRSVVATEILGELALVALALLVSAPFALAIGQTRGGRWRRGI